MRFEGFGDFLNKLDYKGVIGIWYKNDFMMVLIYLLLLVIAILALVGLFTLLKALFRGKKKRKTTTSKKNPNWP